MLWTLSQTLQGHKAAVRTVSSTQDQIISGSSDKTARLYQFLDNKYQLKTVPDFFTNQLYASCPLSDGGFAVSSGSSIYILDADANPMGQLDAHTMQVCSLASPRPNCLISGSWDSTAIIWDLQTQQVRYQLKGHQYGVSVQGLKEQQDHVFTGSQDGVLKFWIKDALQKEIKAHNDIIREIVEVPGIGILTCSNDETIKLWTLDLQNISTFLGHTGFVFSVKLLEMKEIYIVSSSDDNSVKIWNQSGQCVQSINHPGCVWNVAINGTDIITGCSDCKTRVFTIDGQRFATQDELEQYKQEVDLAAAQGPEGLSQKELEKMIPVEKMGTIKGKKHGEVRMFKNGKKPEVYGWNSEINQWEKIGDVVGGSTKKSYPGDKYFQGGEYDYVFDVEDDSGMPKKIPCNDGDNLLEVAERYCRREGLSKTYLQQIIDFLRKNTRPQPKYQSTTQNQPMFQFIPFTQYIFYEQMNLQGMKKKLDEFSQKVPANQSLTDLEQHQINTMLEKLSQTSFYHTSTIDQSPLLVNKLLKWPIEFRLPIYDLLRIFELHPSSEQLYSGLDNGINILSDLGGFMLYNTQNAVQVRLCLQVLCNAFKYNAGNYAMIRHIGMITEFLMKLLNHQDEKVSNVLGNLILSYTISVHQKPTEELVKILAELAIKYLEGNRDNESVAKVITSIGNLSECKDIKCKLQVKQIAGQFLNNLSLFNNESGENCLKEVKQSISNI